MARDNSKTCYAIIVELNLSLLCSVILKCCVTTKHVLLLYMMASLWLHREWRIVLATASMALAMSAPTFRGQLIVGIYVVHIGTQNKVETCLVGSTDWTPATLIITVSELVHLLDSVEQQAALVEQLLTNVYLLAQAASLTVVLSQ